MIILANLTINQTKYINDAAEKFDVTEMPKVNTPAVEGVKFTAQDCPKEGSAEQKVESIWSRSLFFHAISPGACSCRGFGLGLVLLGPVLGSLSFSNSFSSSSWTLLSSGVVLFVDY